MQIDLILAAQYWTKYLLAFLPICLAGIYIIRKTTQCTRLELIIPAGILAGAAVDIFLLSSLSFLVPGSTTIWATEVTFVFLTLGLFVDRDLKKIDKPAGKTHTLFVISLVGWGLYLFNRASYTGFGGDTDIYYSIAKTFANGNWPLRSPWQPSFLVNYHYGGSLLLGQLQYFTNSSFDFIHRMTAFVLMFSAVQLLIWMFKRHATYSSFLIYQLLPLVCLVSVGSLMFVWPHFPLQTPIISSITDLPGWISKLPTGLDAYELWGGPGVIEHFFYFLHHGVGFSIFVLVMFLIFNFRGYLSECFLFIAVFSSLSLAGEAYFIPGLISSGLVIFYSQLKNQTFKKNIIKLTISAILIGLIVLFQGGTITSGALSGEQSVLFFPTKQDFANRWGRVGPLDINGVHFTEISSKLLESRSDWMPFRWFHIGLPWLLSIGLALIIVLSFRRREKIDIAVFFLISSLIAVIAYFAIVHKYVPASNSRFLAASFQFAAILIVLEVIWLYESWKDKLIKMVKVILLSVCLWVLIPSILPPLMSVVRNSDRNFLLTPLVLNEFDSVDWLKKNISIKARVMDMITGSYYTNRWGERSDLRAGIQLSIYAGVMTPLFGPKIRDLHFEASPEYFDAFYTLNPSSFKTLDVNYLVMDDNLFKKLPEIRQQELMNPKYFSLVYKNSQDLLSERIYQINDAFLNEAKDLNGTFAELDQIIPKQAEIFVDDRRDINSWNHLFKAVTLKFKDRNSYTVNSPVTYMQADVYYRIGFADKAPKYDYLILYKTTKPESVCNCHPQLIWQGLDNEVSLWKT